MKTQCAAVFFYQQPWQLDSFNVSAGVGWMTLFSSTTSDCPGCLLLSELAADAVT